MIVVNASGGGDYTTIQAAVNAANDGDTVYVEAGTYQGKVNVGKKINLVGAGRGKTLIFNGVHVTSDWVNISGFMMTDGDTGIFLEQVNHCNISNNICNGNQKYGIYLKQVNHGIIFDNFCCGNEKYGIVVEGGNYSKLSNNVCNQNGCEGPFMPYDSALEGMGIYLWDSNNNTIIGNNCSKNLPGWDYTGATGGYEYGHGIYIYNANDNLILNNIMNEHDSGYGEGIYLNGKRNLLINNTFIQNCIGIGIYNSTNTIKGNTFYNNSWLAIYIQSLIWPYETASNNSIYLNNFLFNNIEDGLQDFQQVCDYVANNHWNDSSGQGNYWSDYSTKYPNATNNSIIWHTPYLIDGSGNNYDLFPLYNPVNKEVFIPLAIAGNDINVNQHQLVYFDGSTTYDEIGIKNYTWSFNYNSTNYKLYGVNSNFIFHAVGSYTITLTVTNAMGNKDRDQMIVNVLDSDSPIPIAGPDVTIRQGETFTFNASVSTDNVGIVNYTWNFTYNENSIALYSISPRFTFEIPGIYHVTLNVSDARANRATDVMRITVTDYMKPTARAGKDVTVDQHETILFDASTSYDDIGIVNYTWNFTYGGCEIVLYGAKSEFKFDEARMVRVTLNVTDTEGNWATDTLNVTVRDITPPNADAGPDITINQSDTVEFFFHQDSRDNIGCWNWTWTFQYNGTAQMLFHSMIVSSLPFFTFEIPDNYTVTMAVYDEAGNWAIDILNITVLDLSLPNEPEIDTEQDSDNDTYNDTFELSQGSDPNNPLSTPFDLDADGWNNSVEIQVGSDPFNNLSVPPDADTDGIPDSLDPDRDGDGVANVDDPYPDDGDRWERPKDMEEEDSAVWWFIGIVVSVLVVGVIVSMVLVTRRGRRRKGIGDDETKDGAVDELGRVGRDGGGEEAEKGKI